MDVIIIGAGAAGLVAARELSAAGIKVCILEARNRIGGRIHSINDLTSIYEIQGGAEFIHGKLKVTLDLLQEAGLETIELGGDIWQVKRGKWSQDDEFYKNTEKVVEKLKALEVDITMADFIEVNFNEPQHDELKKSLIEYIEGYYSGKIENISAKSFLEEWLNEDDQQFRPKDGYGKMINYLKEKSVEAGTSIRLSTVAKKVQWSKKRVEVFDETGNSYVADKALITVPIGVLTAKKGSKGAIDFLPALDDKIQAAKQLGFGAVVKILLRFEEGLFEDIFFEAQPEVSFTNVHMILSDEAIPTWWTQFSQKSNLLTGWLSGPNAQLLLNATDEAVLDLALQSLGTILHTDIHILRTRLKWSKVFNWTRDEFTRGSYSYSTLDTKAARTVLMEPAEETIFFAGEGLYDGPEMGTVEAALTSGLEVAKKIIALKSEKA